MKEETKMEELTPEVYSSELKASGEKLITLKLNQAATINEIKKIRKELIDLRNQMDEIQEKIRISTVSMKREKRKLHRTEKNMRITSDSISKLNRSFRSKTKQYLKKK